MPVPRWLRPLAVRPARTPARQAPRRPAFRPRLEGQEDRTTPSGGGLLDPTFGPGGVVTSSFAGTEGLYDVTLQPDGKVVAAGYVLGANYNFAVARYQISRLDQDNVAGPKSRRGHVFGLCTRRDTFGDDV